MNLRRRRQLRPKDRGVNRPKRMRTRGLLRFINRLASTKQQSRVDIGGKSAELRLGARFMLHDMHHTSIPCAFHVVRASKDGKELPIAAHSRRSLAADS